VLKTPVIYKDHIMKVFKLIDNNGFSGEKLPGDIFRLHYSFIERT